MHGQYLKLPVPLFRITYTCKDFGYLLGFYAMGAQVYFDVSEKHRASILRVTETYSSGPT